MVHMKLKMPDLSNERVVLPLVAAMISAIYLYFTYMLRPSDPVSFPGIEERMWTVLLILIIASAVAYAREILSMLLAVLSRFSRLGIFGKAAHHASWAHAHLRDSVHPAVKRHALRIASRVPRIGAHHVTTPVAKLFSLLGSIAARLLSIIAGIISGILSAAYNFFARVNELGAPIISSIFFFIKKHFARGKPQYFATLGLAIFLILSPLVIYNQKELVESAVLIFIAYIALSYWKGLDDRVMIVAALLFLLSCPFLLIMKENARAELSAIYAYYALCAGVFLQFVDYLQHRDKYDAEEAAEEGQDGKGRNGNLNDKRVREVEEGCFQIDLPFAKKQP